jgi:hypothetical protein
MVARIILVWGMPVMVLVGVLGWLHILSVSDRVCCHEPGRSERAAAEKVPARRFWFHLVASHAVDGQLQTRRPG